MPSEPAAILEEDKNREVRVLIRLMEAAVHYAVVTIAYLNRLQPVYRVCT